MGKGITEQQALAIELTVRASLTDALKAMNIDAADIRVEMVYRRPSEVDLHEVKIVKVPQPDGTELRLPAPTEQNGGGVPAVSGVALATARVAEEKDTLLVDATEDRPVVEGSDFFIADPNALKAKAAAEGRSVAEVATESGVVAGQKPIVVDELGAIDPAVSGPIEDI